MLNRNLLEWVNSTGWAYMTHTIAGEGRVRILCRDSLRWSLPCSKTTSFWSIFFFFLFPSCVPSSSSHVTLPPRNQPSGVQITDLVVFFTSLSLSATRCNDNDHYLSSPHFENHELYCSGFGLVLYILPLSLFFSQLRWLLSALKAAITTDPTLASPPGPCGTPTSPLDQIIADHDHRSHRHFSSQQGLHGYLPSNSVPSSLSTPLSHNFSKPIHAHVFNATALLSLDLSQLSPDPSLLKFPPFKPRLTWTYPPISSMGLCGMSHQLTHLGTLNLSSNRSPMRSDRTDGFCDGELGFPKTTTSEDSQWGPS
ncbi:hypothetical protein LOK49_LG07G02329 [Camellia lanceoleosa]|uniref:Uncharacterized protein n=1 Tax=Camellia lanceoleosa TaxID=1840588 RepID=A0ACC0H795_9ERIC|nr:hypothetical protein LOK49_LG07G02329 [Camellia lanceoleosa]